MKESSILLSIIVPVYNSDINKLNRTIDKIKDNKKIDTEIIIIDDGSEKHIGNEISKRKDIIYYYQSNAGVSSARNKGIDLSRGDYITFLDADDDLLLDNVGLEIFKDNQDLYIFDYFINGQQINIFLNENVNKKEAIKEALIETKLNSIWAKVYKSSKLKKLRFNESMVSGEDAIFFIDFLDYIDSIKYVSKPIYSYIYDESSYIRRTQKFPLRVLENIDYMINRKIEIARKNNLEVYTQRIKEIYTRNYFNAVSYILKIRKLNDEELNHIEKFTLSVDESDNRSHNLRIRLLRNKSFAMIKLVDNFKMIYRRVKK